MKMSFSLVPAVSSDAADIATVFLDSFENDPLISSLRGTAGREANHAWHTRSFEKNFATAERDGARFMKVVDEDGLVFFCFFSFFLARI